MNNSELYQSLFQSSSLENELVFSWINWAHINWACTTHKAQWECEVKLETLFSRNYQKGLKLHTFLHRGEVGTARESWSWNSMKLYAIHIQFFCPLICPLILFIISEMLQCKHTHIHTHYMHVHIYRYIIT